MLWLLLACGPKQPPTPAAPPAPPPVVEVPEPEPAPQPPASVDLDQPPGFPRSPARESASTKPWAADYNRAVQAYNAGDLAGCQEALAPHRELEDSRERRLVHGLDWECGMHRGHYASTGALLVERIHDGTVPEAAAIQHAVILMQAERPEEALAWLELYPMPEQPRWQTAKLRALALSSNWTALAELAGSDKLSAPQRASAGITLVQAGEGALAVPILESTCPELEGRSQEQCQQWLERAR